MSDEHQADESSGLEHDDFVRLHYTVRIADDKEVVDTTEEEVAEEAGLGTDDHEFGPQTVVVGGGHVFDAVDDALVGTEVGEDGSITVPPEEAFGEFDSDDVRTVSAEKIDEDDRYPGAHVTVDGEQGHVEAIIGGRARVDFNHPLAGEDIEYEYEVLEQLTDPTEQAGGLLGVYLQDSPGVRIETDEVEEEVRVEPDDEDAEPEFETETVEKETLYIEATPGMAMNQQWLFQKQQIAQQLIQQLDVDRVVVEEVIEGSGLGMGGMMGGGAPAEVEEALSDADVDAEELAEEIEGAAEE